MPDSFQVFGGRPRRQAEAGSPASGGAKAQLRLAARLPRRTTRPRGQALTEFALVVPVIFVILAAIIQFGILFWAQNTLTQVVRDTGRWEATQGSCSNSSAVVTQANTIAGNSSLIGYSSWSAALSQGTEGVYVQFLPDPSPGATCPPADNTSVDYVKVSVTHRIPTFFPGLEYLPLLGTCDPSGCHVDISSSAQFRLEPQP